MSKKKESVLRYSAVAATLSALEAGTTALSDIEYIGTHDPNAAYKKHNKVIKDYAYYFAVQDVPINSTIPVTDVNYWKLILDFNTPFTDVQDALIVSETNADESALDAEKQAQNTTSFTDSNGVTFSKGAKGYASDASQSATDSQNSATTSSQSASQASTHKTNAETAETNAVTAKNAAESAESIAVTAQIESETARDESQDSFEKLNIPNGVILVDAIFSANEGVQYDNIDDAITTARAKIAGDWSMAAIKAYFDSDGNPIGLGDNDYYSLQAERIYFQSDFDAWEYLLRGANVNNFDLIYDLTNENLILILTNK